ncbi:hypothetical protein V6Z11_D13G175700 [Gossypium hirsutum]
MEFFVDMNSAKFPKFRLRSWNCRDVSRIGEMTSKTQKNYGKPHLRNKWDTLKKEWRLWRELLKESTDIRWCPSKKMVDATEEWWAEKYMLKNPDFRGFKKKGIEPQLNELMWQMFGGIVATGENMIHLMRDLVIQMNIVMRMKIFLLMRYHQTLLMKLLIEENKHFGLNTLTTHIKKLYESMASSRKSVNEIIFPHSQYTISNAMDALRALGDEILKKDELYYFAIKMFQILVKREVFLNLDPDDSVWWLRPTSSFPFQPYHQPPPP